eukprot:9697025-Alexandrium_andersonii.AAC.1
MTGSTSMSNSSPAGAPGAACWALAGARPPRPPAPPSGSPAVETSMGAGAGGGVAVAARNGSALRARGGPSSC